jgi:hypothetical protein
MDGIGVEGPDGTEIPSESEAGVRSEKPSSSHEEVLYQCAKRHRDSRFEETAGGGARLTGNTFGDGTGRVHIRSVSGFEYKRCVRDIPTQRKAKTKHLNRNKRFPVKSGYFQQV